MRRGKPCAIFRGYDKPCRTKHSAPNHRPSGAWTRRGKKASSRRRGSSSPHCNSACLWRCSDGEAGRGSPACRRRHESCLRWPQGEDFGPAAVTRIAWEIAVRNLGPLALGGLAIALATLAFRLATTRFGVSLKLLSPQFKRLDPLARLRELPRQNSTALLQALVLLPLFLWAVYAIARDRLDAFLAAAVAGRRFGYRGCCPARSRNCLWKAAGVFLVFGAVDLFRQLRRYRRGPAHEQAGDPRGSQRTAKAIRR